MLAPLHQDQAYHRFADSRALLGIPNFADVVSSVVLVLIGILGIWLLWRNPAGRSVKVSASGQTYPTWATDAAPRGGAACAVFRR